MRREYSRYRTGNLRQHVPYRQHRRTNMRSAEVCRCETRLTDRCEMPRQLPILVMQICVTEDLMRRLLILFIVTVLTFSADLRALASHEDIIAESTDKAHPDADHVRIERDGSDATVVITRNRGIGSARVQIAG